MVRDTIPCSLVDCSNVTEMIWAKLCCSRVSVLVGAFYCPPNGNVSSLGAIQDFISEYSKRYTHMVLAVDFNLPHINWDHMQTLLDCQQPHLLIDIVFSWNLTQVVCSPTRSTNACVYSTWSSFPLRSLSRASTAKHLKVLLITLWFPALL